MMRIERWKTPLTKLPARTVGNARLGMHLYEPGYYRMEGVLGHELFKVEREIVVRSLQRRGSVGGTPIAGDWQEWMVDDPLHWYGMRERVMELPPGRLWIAGLGMGLMLHHLIDRPDVTEITVVELDADVIDLMGPTTPRDPRVTIVNDDWYAFIERDQPKPDGVLWDLSVGKEESTSPAMEFARQMQAVYLPWVPDRKSVV